MSDQAPDITDLLIDDLVRARELGFSRNACLALVADVFAAPWSSPPKRISIHAVAASYVAERAQPVSAKADFAP